jgi:hypothetical protein
VISASASVLAVAAHVLASDEEFDPNTVTPGIWGFVLTFFVMVAVVLLILDMTRRMRRVNMRAQVQAQLAAEAEAAARDAELAEADGQAIDSGDAMPPTEVPGPTDAPGDAPEGDAFDGDGPDDEQRPGPTPAR